MPAKAKTVDDYLAAQPPLARRLLKRVRTVIRRALPGAEEVLSYGIPAYRLNKRIAIYFAGWKDHFSLYPISKRMEKQLAGHDLSGRGTIRFSYEDRLPVHLISHIAQLRAEELSKK
jgi:uncharacterized protein YdhG (YjbR/CyaY superfamily)